MITSPQVLEWQKDARAEGRVEGCYDLLLRLGQKKFGPADAMTSAKLKGIVDLERLERVAEEILSANSWDELLATK